MNADRAQRYAEWLVANKDRKGSPDFEKVAAAYKVARGGVEATSEDQRRQGRFKAAQQAAAAENDPTKDMSGPSRFFAGLGKAVSDTARGGAQIVGAGAELLNPIDPNSSGLDEAAQSAVDQAAQRDKPLMNTAGGAGGYLTGQVIKSAPAAFIPGANTVLGSGLIGAGYGLMEPVQTGGSRMSNAATSAGFGAAGQAAANLVPAVGRGFIAPFTRRGQQDIAAETLQRFASNPDTIAGNLPTSNVPGIQYTLAEATQDPGLSTLQRAMMNRPEMSQILGPQEIGNVSAARGALERIAGNPDEMGFWMAARDSATDPLYAASNAASVRPDADLQRLLSRPSMTDAVNRAANLSAERGQGFQLAGRGHPAALESSGGALHRIKMAMDDMLKPQPGGTGIVGNEADAIRDTRESFVNWMNTNLPGYSDARTTYANYSRPINQMQIGRELADKLTPALNDFGAEIPNIRPSAYAQALREADDTARRATGFGGARIDNILTQEQMDTVNGIGEYLARREFGRNAGRPPGTNTAQNIASGQLMRRILGPMGLPESWTESAAMPAVLRLPQWALRTQEPGIQSELARAMLDPRYAAMIMQQAGSPTRARLLAALLRDRIMPVASQTAGGMVNE